MGWKNVKKHYQIQHLVSVQPDVGIQIGNVSVLDMILIDFNGEFVTRYENKDNPIFLRYQREMDADPDKLRELVQSSDTFLVSIPVYTCEDGKIIEKYCERPGWPNVTHDGCLMQQATFSTNKDVVIAWAKQYARLGKKRWEHEICEMDWRLVFCQRELEQVEHNLYQLELVYPD